MERKSSIGLKKSPRQIRSKLVVESILEASIRVLKRHGFQLFNTTDVAQEAGISVGSLYQYFPNREALTTELFMRHVESTANMIERTVEDNLGVPLPVTINRIIEQLISCHRSDAELLQILHYEIPNFFRLDRYLDLRARVLSVILDLFERNRAEIGRVDLARASKISTQLIEGMIHSLVIEDPAGLADAELSNDLTGILCHFLEMPPRPKVTQTHN